MVNKKFKMTTQTRLFLLGMIISTVFIAAIGYFSIQNIQQNLNAGYKNFGQIISKTLAIEGIEITRDLPEYGKYDMLRSHSQSILKSNDDIAFIEFRDQLSNVIYSSKDDYPKQAEKAHITVSSPMVVKDAASSQVVGSVIIGLSGTIINNISTTTRTTLMIIFVLVWLAVATNVTWNSILTTRELKKLHDGVKRIATGEFGYQVEGKGMSHDAEELFASFNEMSQRLRHYEEQNIEQLTYEKNKLEGVLMSIVNGVVVCDNTDKIILVNNQAQNLLEVKQEEILNSKIHQYCDTSGKLCFADKIDEFKDTPLDEMENRPLEFNIEIDGRIIKALISPMFSHIHEYVGYIIILIDVTKEIETDKLRSDFISNVSHELRTPVTVLRTYIDTLYNFGNDFDFNTQREFIGVMNQEIERLNKMVNDVLDFSRYASNNLKIAKTKCNVVRIIENCVAQMSVLAKEHNLTLSVMKEPDLPEIMANHDCIERALSNILSNAIKYSPDGKRIKIRAELARVGDFLEVSVEDQGPGIAPQYLDKIFDRFFRIENDTHTIKGTGLGLHLVKVAIEKHHQGEVFVQSNLNEGSIFGFRLPLHPVDEPEEYTPKHTPQPVTSFSANTPEFQKPENNGGWEISLEKREI